MKAERVRQAILDGYEITIDASTCEHPQLHRHAVFDSVETFDEALARARARLVREGARAAARWTLRTVDGCIRYRAHTTLSEDVPYATVCQHIELDSRAVLCGLRAHDVSAVAVAKVMRYAALVLRAEATRAHATDAIAQIERLLPHDRVRSAARIAGGRS